MNTPHNNKYYRFAALIPFAEKGVPAEDAVHDYMVILAPSSQAAVTQTAEAGLLLLGAIGTDGKIYPNPPI